LLARIHRLTLEGLRRQIAPVPFEQYVRFLVDYQNLRRDKMPGQMGVLHAIEQLEGFEAPAGHWERFLLPARVQSYNPVWLDALSFSGQVSWGRLRPLPPRNAVKTATTARPMKATTRSTPITLFHHDHLSWLLPTLGQSDDLAAQFGLGGNASAAYEAFLRHGALFPNQLASLLQLMPTQVADVLGELAAAGLVTSDSFSGLRMLIGSTRAWRGSYRSSMVQRPLQSQATGRWTLLHSSWIVPASDDERIEQWCRLLLRRYAVMFRDLLFNESTAPPWRDLVRGYRRLEARGEIRGGRFIANVSGEQYALPDVISTLRSTVEDAQQQPIVLPGTDPLNFSGYITSGPRVPALPGNSIVILRGEIHAHGRSAWREAAAKVRAEAEA
jgi:ATP-dependent Lhr-like helicase